MTHPQRANRAAPVRCAAVLMLLVATSSPTFADNDGFKIELTPFGAYRFGGSINVEGTPESYKLQDSPGFGLMVNWEHTPETKWEVLYSQQHTAAELDGTTVNDSLIDVDLQVLQLGGTYQFEGGRAKSYLAATFGGTHVRAQSSGSRSDTFWSGSIGLGVLIRPNSRLGLRLEARYHGTLVNSSSELLCQTGPDINVCAARIEGDMLSQVETLAGIVIRF